MAKVTTLYKVTLASASVFHSGHLFRSDPTRVHKRRKALVPVVLSALLITSTLQMERGNAASTELRYEPKSLPLVATSGDSLTASFCNGKQCAIFESNAVGDYLTYSVNVPTAQKYTVKVIAKRDPTGGVFRLAIKSEPSPKDDGSINNHGSPVDFYSATPDYPVLTVGTVWFGTAGTKQFRFTVTGKNSSSSGYTLGLDAIILLPATATTSAGTKLVSTNFDNFPIGSISAANFRRAMNDSNLKLSNDLKRTSIVNSPGHGRVIRQALPANQYGGPFGITADAHLPRAVDEVSIQYDIKFDSNFQWGLGGKLPGLGGTKAGVNPSVATGCDAGTPSAWSGRAMWRVPSSGKVEWRGYMYNNFKKERCGDTIQTKTGFVAGKWHTVKQYYKMNSISGGKANADGTHRMWIDGELVAESTSYRYRSDTKLHANMIYWEIFRGGSSSPWATSRVGYIDIDNLLITAP
jgi:hypothetical protein